MPNNLRWTRQILFLARSLDRSGLLDYIEGKDEIYAQAGFCADCVPPSCINLDRLGG